MDYIKKQYLELVAVLKEEKTQLFLLYLLSFLIPFLFKKPQLLVGSLVNMILILGATKFEVKELVPMLILPSITSFLNGVLLGNLTPFLLYLIPFIILSNTVYVLVYKKVEEKVSGILLASLLKATILFITASILFRFNLIPKMLLTSMGTTQLVTALIGGTVGYLLTKTSKK